MKQTTGRGQSGGKKAPQGKPYAQITVAKPKPKVTASIKLAPRSKKPGVKISGSASGKAK